MTDDSHPRPDLIDIYIWMVLFVLSPFVLMGEALLLSVALLIVTVMCGPEKALGLIRDFFDRWSRFYRSGRQRFHCVRNRSVTTALVNIIFV